MNSNQGTFTLDSLSDFQKYVDESHVEHIFYEKRNDDSFILWAGRCSWRGRLKQKGAEDLLNWISDHNAIGGKYTSVEELFHSW